METITIWAEMSSLATDAQRKVAPDINALNAIQSTDIANIRKILKTLPRAEPFRARYRPPIRCRTALQWYTCSVLCVMRASSPPLLFCKQNNGTFANAIIFIYP